ncbi:ABC transporter substrate-binding protein [Amaricoccus solimangrovi]|uniref:ABC transporter substrate-binding protein n=1 Tax=Amaricoccus solimangrovi TaxID=2589815 RepID=A0A501WQI8_9RHOB|nr:ABC transporter substrate-binding protein [Amaricoccus solimangrovi]TPE51618.1 ABC transporter substrate-binding protein [Amaricoccus solimangrovi]
MTNENSTNHRAIDAALRDLGAGRMNRRAFVGRALALGLALPATTALMSGQARATPTRGGTFRVGMADGASTDNWDPAVTNTRYMIHMNHVNRNMLTTIRSDNTLGPELAKSWQATPDAKTWTFDLVEGVTFHSGKSMTSEDVIATINYHRDPKSESAVASLLEQIADIKADGPNRVIFTLSGGNADFPYLMTDYHLCILPSDGAGGVVISEDGTGAYMVVSHQPGVRTELVRNPNYWKQDAAYFDGVVFTSINDATARQSALMTGSVDAVDEVSVNTVSLLSRAPGILIDTADTASYVSMPMRMNVAPFDNADVRMALKLGLPRQQIIDTVLGGYGVIGNDHPVAPTMPFHADLEQRPYDPEQARFHLKRAGFDRLSVDFHCSDAPFAGGVDAAVLYQQALVDAGIDLNIVREPTDGYWSNVWNVKPFTLGQWGARPTPDMILSLVYQSGAPWNESMFSDGRFDRILVEARAELDNARRADMYAELQRIVRDEAGTPVPFFKKYVFARRDTVMHGDALTGTWPLDGYHAVERWWFA